MTSSCKIQLSMGSSGAELKAWINNHVHCLMCDVIAPHGAYRCNYLSMSYASYLQFLPTLCLYHTFPTQRSIDTPVNVATSDDTLKSGDIHIRQWSGGGGGRRFKNAYGLLNLKNQCCIKIISFKCMGKVFCMEFQRILWNSTPNILSIHWQM